MTVLDPSGNKTYTCLEPALGSTPQTGAESANIINQQFNSIINQGYKLVSTGPNNTLGEQNNVLYPNGVWYFAVP